MTINKKIILAALILIFTAITVGFLVGVYLLPKLRNEGQTYAQRATYYGVLLETGDFYIGRLSRFPRWRMTDVYIIQRDETTNELTLLSLKETSVWSPDSIKINPKKVVIWGRVGRDSQIMETLAAFKERARSPQNILDNIQAPPQLNQDQTPVQPQPQPNQ
ncbi:MAG: hypothetical protein KY053_02040 [Candidatus Liptonbacteria bacterium]|nr:hypothetical protein [Candidatus Liptonbacteria bacterium]